MKILITTDWYKPVINGVVTSVVNLKEELEKSGHEVKVLTLSQKGTAFYEEDTYYVKSFGVKIYPQARATYSFRNKFVTELIKWKPDVIHSQCEWITFVFAKHIAQKLQIPIVHTYHTIYEDYTHYLMKSEKLGKQLVLFSSNKVLNATDYIVTPTNKARNLLLSYGIVNPIVTVPTGIDLEKYSVSLSEEKKEILLKKYGINSDKKIIVTVGRLALEKNIDDLILKMRYIKKFRQDIVLLIVGGGPYEAQLRQTVKKLGLDDCIKFSGMVSPKEVPDYFRLGEIFVSSSQSEAQGLTYIEALSCSLPLLCRKDECLDGVLVESVNGWFFKTDEEFKERLEEMLFDEAEYKMLKQNAEITSISFAKETFGRNIIAVYEKAIKNFQGHETGIKKVMRRIKGVPKSLQNRSKKIMDIYYRNEKTKD